MATKRRGRGRTADVGRRMTRVTERPLVAEVARRAAGRGTVDVISFVAVMSWLEPAYVPTRDNFFNDQRNSPYIGITGRSE